MIKHTKEIAGAEGVDQHRKDDIMLARGEDADMDMVCIFQTSPFALFLLSLLIYILQRGGAVETGCSDLYVVMCCFTT